jgi:hypothetical protein
MRKLVTILILFFTSETFVFTDTNIKKMIEEHDPELLLHFYIEGDFTGSGLIECIAFYQYKSTLKAYYAIDKTYCFIFDKSDKLQNIFEMPWVGTVEFDEYFNLNNFPLRKLGKSINWIGYSIGRTGDFNKNGKDELYLFSLGGNRFIPEVFEFDENEKIFKSIFDTVVYGNIMLIEVDDTQKRLVFAGGFPSSNGLILDRDGGMVVYQWDDSKQLYVKRQPDEKEIKEAYAAYEAEKSIAAAREEEDAVIPEPGPPVPDSPPHQEEDNSAGNPEPEPSSGTDTRPGQEEDNPCVKEGNTAVLPAAVVIGGALFICLVIVLLRKRNRRQTKAIR